MIAKPAPKIWYILGDRQGQVNVLGKAGCYYVTGVYHEDNSIDSRVLVNAEIECRLESLESLKIGDIVKPIRCISCSRISIDEQCKPCKKAQAEEDHLAELAKQKPPPPPYAPTDTLRKIDTALEPGHYLKDALHSYKDIYGADDMQLLKFHLSSEVYAALYRESFKYYQGYIDSGGFMNIDNLVAFYGFGVVIDNTLCGGECAIIAGDNQYHFEIPERAKTKKFEHRPKPETSYGTYPKPLTIDFGLLRWARKKTLRFIDWYHEFKFMPGRVRFVPITNTDDKFLGKQIKVRRNLLYPFYGNKEIITIEPITAKTKNKPNRKAKQPAEQMATLGELFEGYESTYTHLTNATLGNEKGQVRCGDEVHCYARSQDGLDNNGGAQYRKAFPVYCGDSDIDLYEAGTPVYVEYVDETGLSIVDRERGTPHTMGGGR